VRYVPFTHLVDEVVQQVYVEFLDGADRWDFDGNVKALLALMTQNIARAHWKSESRNFPEKLHEIAEHIRQIAEDKSRDDDDQYARDLQAMKTCLEKAPEKSGELISLRYLDGLSFKEIATLMNLNTDSVCKAVYRLKEKLRNCIKQTLREKESHV